MPDQITRGPTAENGGATRIMAGDPSASVVSSAEAYASSILALNASISSSIGSAIAWIFVQYSGSYHWA